MATTTELNNLTAQLAIVRNNNAYFTGSRVSDIAMLVSASNQRIMIGSRGNRIMTISEASTAIKGRTFMESLTLCNVNAGLMSSAGISFTRDPTPTSIADWLTPEEESQLLYSSTPSNYFNVRLDGVTRIADYIVPLNSNVIDIGSANLPFSNVYMEGSVIKSGNPVEFSQWQTLADGNIGIQKRVGIMTTDPQYQLHVEGDIYASQNVFHSSDERLKTDVEPISDALNKVRQIKGYTFTRKETGKREVGLIAQEVERVIPEIVSKDDHGMLSVSYASSIALLFQAVHEISSRLEALEAFF
jgi:hypothetical protein